MWKVSRPGSFLLLALLVGNAGVSYSQAPKTKKTTVRLEYDEDSNPNNLYSVVNGRLLDLQRHYEQTAKPFKCTFTRRDLQTLLAKIDAKRLEPAA